MCMANVMSDCWTEPTFSTSMHVCACACAYVHQGMGWGIILGDAPCKFMLLDVNVEKKYAGYYVKSWIIFDYNTRARGNSFILQKTVY